MFVVASFSLLFLALIASYGHGTSYTSFDGSTYVTYSYRKEPRTFPDDIVVVFRTIKPSGILFHATSSGGDFVTLELLRGKIRCSIYVRSLPILSSENVFVKDHEDKELDLADNEVHQIHIMRTQERASSLTLFIDVTEHFIDVPGFYTKRFTEQTFYLGGVDASRIHPSYTLLRKLPFVPFEGCLDNDYVTVNGLELLDLVTKGNATVHGKLITGCNITPEGYHPITFLKPESFIKVIVPSRATAKYSFKFRTYNGAGILLVQKITKSNGATISISLDSGRIKVEVEFVSNSPVTLYGGAALDDGMWHHVGVNISIRNVRLGVDSELSSQSRRSQGTFRSSSKVFVGALPSDKSKPGFIGCMRDLIVQGKKVNFTTVYKSQVKIAACTLHDLCLPNPCQNGGRCSQRWNRTICHCSGTDFKGEKCETPSFFMQTCADWWVAGKRISGYYKINPRDSEPFAVYCNMTNVNGPSTVIFHTQDRNPIIAAQNKVNRRLYSHEISYENSNDHNIRDLIATSTHCRQYLEYNCYNSVIFDSPKTLDLKSGRGARWVSRDGKLQDYWSGASHGSMKCACGMNGTCVESSKVCNCDAVDNKWHVDGGYLTDSTSLPVKRLIFSVDGTSKISNYVLGSLECYGSTTIRTTTVITIPENETLTTPQPPTKRQTKSPSTETTITTSETHLVTKPDKTSISTTQSSFPNSKDPSTPKLFPIHTQATATPTNNSVPPGIVVIESPRKFITIRENANQELVLIILSVILAVFVIAIVVLLIKQNLFFPCKCLQVPLYHDVRNMDTIELGAPSPADPEPILQFEASPYPARNFDIGLHDCHIPPSPELYSDAETDRLDISNGSSSWISENADIDKGEPEKQTAYEDLDLGLIDVVSSFPASKQLSTEQQIKRLKEVIFDVLSGSDVRANYSDRKSENPASVINQTKNPKDTTQCESNIEVDPTQRAANEQLVESDNDSTATMSELSGSNDELFNGDKCAKEPFDELCKGNVLETCKPDESNEHTICRSSDPHDNYLSLDVNQLEDDSVQRQPLRGSNMDGKTRDDEQNPCDKDLIVKYLPASCDEISRELRSRERKHSSPRARLFSRQKSEEEALLSSTLASGQDRASRCSDDNQKRYSGISNAFCRQPHQQQNASADDENQHENFINDDNDSISARAIPLKQSHSQKYETEL